MRNETKGILLLSLSMFLLLITYYVLKTVRESLILTQGGAEVKSYSAFAQALILLFVVPAYSALASRVKRVTLMSWIMLIFAANLLVMQPDSRSQPIFFGEHPFLLHSL